MHTVNNEPITIVCVCWQCPGWVWLSRPGSPDRRPGALLSQWPECSSQRQFGSTAATPAASRLCTRHTLHGETRRITHTQTHTEMISWCIHLCSSPQLCQAKGFICEFCGNDKDIIFPYELSKCLRCEGQCDFFYPLLTFHKASWRVVFFCCLFIKCIYLCIFPFLFLTMHAFMQPIMFFVCIICAFASHKLYNIIICHIICFI